MRKYLLLTLAVLFVMSGIALADSVPLTEDAKNYPVVWTADIYNGSGATITSGYIAEWDFAVSDSTVDANDDMCPYVQLADSAGDVWTMGVVPYGRDIPNNSPGTVIIRGAAYVLEGSSGVSADQICESDASGLAQTMDVTGNDEGSIGICIQDDPASAGPDDNSIAWCIIYVDPTQHEI